MNIRTLPWAAPMTFFVLLWSSAPLFTRWGLNHASVMALLALRFAAALAALLILGWRDRSWLPASGTRWRVAGGGLMMMSCYSVCYFQSMAHGMTPGVLATVLGTQPVLTLLATERRFAPARLAGLLLALCGLALVVWQSLIVARLSGTGVLFSLGALACMTTGALVQSQVKQSPGVVLPLQCALSLGVCLILGAFQPVHVEWNGTVLISVLWLGLVVSVGAQMLLYRMMASGNLVNVTSLFYLVPVVTALLDYLVLGNALTGWAMLGMGIIIAGLLVVFRVKKPGG